MIRNRYILRVFGSLFLSLLVIGTNAAGGLDFERISIGQGISQSDITAMCQDSTGFMWFATNNGLNRYDGYSFRTFKADSRDSTSLSSSIIFSMIADGGRYLWIATKEAIDRYDAVQDRFVRYSDAIDKNGNKVSLGRVNAFCKTRDRELWGVMRGYVICFDAKANLFRAYNVQNSTTGSNLIVLNDLCENRDGRILIATNKGIHVFDRRNLKARLLFNPETACEGRLSRILSLFVDSLDDLIYAGGEEGLFVIDAHGRFVREIRYEDRPIRNVSEMMRDSFGRLWIGTRENGLFIEEAGELVNCRYDSKDDTTVGSNYILSLCEDVSGVVWVGTSAGGVSKMYCYKKPFRIYGHYPHLPNSLSHNVVMAVYSDEENRIWAATKDGVLNCIHLPSGVVTRFDEQIRGMARQNIKIHGIIRRNEKELWLATSNGLYAFDMSTGRFDSTPVKGVFGDLRIRSMMYDDEGLLWLLSRQGGVYVIDGDRMVAHYTVANMGLSDNYVRGICQDHRGDIWIGTRDGGVNRLRRSGDTYEVSVMRNIPNDPFSLSLDNISVIYEDSHNRLWIGTWGGGLNFVTDRERLRAKSYTEHDGLCDNVIFGIFEDDAGKLWISTYNGLSCFDPERGEFRNYNAADGLPSDEFMTGAYSMTQQGEMVFGTINGVVVFRPEEIKRANTLLPKLAITGLFIGGKEVRPGSVLGRYKPLDSSIYFADRIVLPYNKSTFRLELASFSYGVPGQNKFAYQLEGMDEEWNYLGSNNSVSYSSLRPGKYVFRFKATNSDGLWNETPCELEILITPPFWASNWAYVLYALLFIFAGFVAIRIFRRNQERRNRNLQERLKMENEQALYKAKVKFYTNISHELRTPLALIAGLIERIEHKLGSDNSVKTQLTVMKRNNDRLLNLVNDLLDLRSIETGHRKPKPQTRDVVSLIRAVWSYFGPEAESRGVSFMFDSPMEYCEATLDFGKTEKILYNLLSNAMKFTKTFVKVVLRVEDLEGQEYIVITVCDDGPGISEEEHEKIFYRFYQSESNDSSQVGSGLGLNLAQELTKLQGGELTVSSRLGEGAAFCLRLPADITKSVASPAMSVSYDETNNPEDGRASEAHHPLILIVDDNSDMRYYMKDMLCHDFRIAEANNGREAIESARKLRPDLVVCDLMMPEMDGIEVCRVLKETPATSKIPVILMTAKVAEESRIEGLREGADAYLIKPFTEEHLQALISNIFKGRSSMRTAISREIISTPQRQEVFSVQDKLLAKIVALLEKNIADSEYDVDRLSAELHISRVHLYRQMKTIVGQSPSDFIRDFRLAKAAGILEQNKLDVSEVTYMVGFNSPKYFSTCFKKKYGVAPQEYAARFAADREGPFTEKRR